ncbi:hypothetical protein T4D_614 [Trichinella pseudospiralis]|uniref:Uncharacterized protein n=1 Tax=Trichinella pseudospiralis TaxID=6337 RepID=A0A0V1FZS7_TRIPS|nr:hypothetical protein T4D_614 [Trichinella pseudospiralis]
MNSNLNSLTAKQFEKYEKAKDVQLQHHQSQSKQAVNRINSFADAKWAVKICPVPTKKNYVKKYSYSSIT